MADVKQLKDDELEVVEADIVDALVSAAEYRSVENHRQPIRIMRDGKTLFKFTLESVSEDIWRKCRNQNYINRNRRNEDFNEARFASQLIFEATIDADKARLWNNKAVWRKLNVVTGVDVVNAVLLPAEKLKLVSIIEELSGYDENIDSLIEE